jgi:hypothetical protein
MKLETRIALEKKIVRKTVRELLAAGYEIAVDNGEEQLPYTTHYSSITSALFSTDEVLLIARKGDQTSFVYLVYGNDGYDVINDYGMTLAPIMSVISRYVDKLD